MNEKTIEQLLEEQNELLRQQNKMLEQRNATANAHSFRENMRGIARQWDDANPVFRFFADNPYGKWK